MHTQTIVVASVFLMIGTCYWATAGSDEQSTDNKPNVSTTVGNEHEHGGTSDKRSGKYRNYLRLSEGDCYNCSTYKCTNNKDNLGGSNWCIMLFPAAIAHCDADPNCAGYTMTTSDWFHKEYDQKGQVAVHLSKAGEKPIPCPLLEWSSYEKQNTFRDTPVVYGRSTCSSSDQGTCDKHRHINYVFVGNSNAASTFEPYLCKNHPKNLDNKASNCILPIADAVKLCNEDDKCDGFLMDTDDAWQKKFSSNGMQGVQLVGQGVNLIPSQTWRSFKKQY